MRTPIEKEYRGRGTKPEVQKEEKYRSKGGVASGTRESQKDHSKRAERMGPKDGIIQSRRKGWRDRPESSGGSTSSLSPEPDGCGGSGTNSDHESRGYRGEGPRERSVSKGPQPTGVALPLHVMGVKPEAAHDQGRENQDLKQSGKGRASSRLASKPTPKAHWKWEDFHMPDRSGVAQAKSSHASSGSDEERSKSTPRSKQEEPKKESPVGTSMDIHRLLNSSSPEAAPSSSKGKRKSPPSDSDASDSKSAAVPAKQRKTSAEPAAPSAVIAPPVAPAETRTNMEEREKDHDKYCHFCQHVKINMLACSSPTCTHRYCIYCLSSHLGDDTNRATSDAWVSDLWKCPTCRAKCCCSATICTHDHRHCKAYRYRLRRADAASMRATAAHALVSLAAFGTKPEGKGKQKGDKKEILAAKSKARKGAAGLAQPPAKTNEPEGAGIKVKTETDVAISEKTAGLITHKPNDRKAQPMGIKQEPSRQSAPASGGDLALEVLASLSNDTSSRSRYSPHQGGSLRFDFSLVPYQQRSYLPVWPRFHNLTRRHESCCCRQSYSIYKTASDRFLSTSIRP